MHLLLKLYALILVDGTWDIGYLHDILLLGAIDHVVGVLPPSTDETQDMLAWRSTQDGNFTMASAYELMVKPSWESLDPKWSHIWSLPVPQHIRTFL
ncbi:hypothetical protein V6N12_030984 [Hibiscus sabdariffa]|uniref:Uncharacterized protein n=1 Tax=Hibiscus sabdariffa TaxID=183260 RepID=A0ABR2E7K5_9ROSI